MDFSKLLSQANQMQERMQKELAEVMVEASAGGGMVQVRMNGMKQLVAITIEKEAVDPEDVSTLQSLILSATNEASRQVDEAVKERLGKVSGGLSGLLGM